MRDRRTVVLRWALTFFTAGLILTSLFASMRKGEAQTQAPRPTPAKQTAAKAAPPPTVAAAHYALPFGANPFAPSNAASATGAFIPAEDFIPADRCAKCHTDAHAQWNESAHRNSFREPFYQKNVNDLIAQRGIEFTRHCESCHNPAALFSGALTKDSPIKRPFDEDGVSCIACHSIQTATGRGIGGYVMGQPALL
ncbi:MAG: hypothetical protein H0T45_08755, partial [Pyrinomonadaceae bacterium]|nr:hypothetical protein [Pyrinomonadaceae bacterium]